MDPIQFISTGNQGNEFVLNEEAIRLLDRETRYEAIQPGVTKLSQEFYSLKIQIITLQMLSFLHKGLSKNDVTVKGGKVSRIFCISTHKKRDD